MMINSTELMISIITEMIKLITDLKDKVLMVDHKPIDQDVETLITEILEAEWEETMISRMMTTEALMMEKKEKVHLEETEMIMVLVDTKVEDRQENLSQLTVTSNMKSQRISLRITVSLHTH